MNIRHESIKINGVNKIYIYVEMLDEYEFGEEFLKPNSNNNFLDKFKKYITQKVDFDDGDTATLIVNGILIGAISLGVFTNASANQIKENAIYENQANYQVAFDYKNKEDKDKAKELELQKTVTMLQNNEIKKDDVVATPIENVQVETAKVVTAAPAATPIVVTSPAPAPTPTSTPAPVTGTTIQLKTNGNVVTMNLEDYVEGVVASEMPITYQIEALKSQAIVARTFAMKKKSEGAILLNSTSNQTYKSESQQKQMWGSSYTTNYNKIRNAVDSTKGLVLTYNGKYIDALYHSISNSKTEMPKYVWGSSLPYLQSVSSNWDTKVKGFEVSKDVSYSTLSSKLGKTISKNTEFTILSETVSGRVENIKIGDSTYSGVKLRSLLGLRSTDFKIVKGDTSVTITTRGFGHGVGMSQSGANEAAKDGYTYDKILKHYYTGVAIVKK
jgi:stage II sporulation protein D